MNKKSKIALIAIFSIIILVCAAYMFVIPNLIDLNAFKPQIQKAAKEATGLEIDPGKLKLATYPDLSIRLTADSVKVDKYLTLEKASIRILLLPLAFKKLEIEEISLDKPEVTLTRLKNGKYDIEQVLENLKKSSNKTSQGNPERTKKKAIKDQIETNKEPKRNKKGIEPVFSGMTLYISDYKVNLTDLTAASPRKFMLKGNLLEISKFKPDKFIKLATNGSLLVENTPNINFDIKLASELPLIKLSERTSTGTAQETAVKSKAKQQPKPAQTIDPIAKILKYDPKVDIKADLELKSREKLPEINGTLDFDKLSLNIDGQKLPESYGKFDFSGKNIKVDSKLFVTSDSFFEASGNINDLTKQDFDINVKSSDIQLKDVKKFAYSLADAANADISILNDIDLSGIVKADFNLQKDSYDGYLNIIETTISHKSISQPLKNLNATLNFDKDKVVFENTSGKLADIGFNVTGNINSKLFSDLKINIPAINLKTVYNILNDSKLFTDLKPQLKDIASVNGNLIAVIILEGQLDKQIAPEINIGLNKISAYHKPSKTPISLTDGNINVDKNGKVTFNNVKSVIADTPLDITGEFTGNANNWSLLAQTDLTHEYIIGKNTLKINAKGSPKSINIGNTSLYSGEKQLVSVEGSIDNNTVLNNVKVNISGLKLNIKEPKGTAQINGELILSGKTDAPKALGTLSLSSLDIPSLKLKTNDVGITLKDEAILVNTGVLNLDDSKIKLTSVIENKLTPPYVVRSVDINSDYLDIDKLSVALQQPQPAPVSQHSSAPASKQANNNRTAAPANGTQDISVIINKGKFYAKELIVNKLQNKDVSFDFTLKPLNQLAIRNFTTHTAGGVAIGLADMDLKTTKLSVDATADNIEINALATVLANMPNQIFGGMNGKVKLSTIGKTPELMVQNAIGRVEFDIKDGYLGKLGDLEYLLKIVSLKLDDNEKTNHFDTMHGLVQVNRGVLDVQEIKMQGKRMSSFISGSIKMKDNYAELTMLSKLSGKIVGQLGFIADLSVNKLAKQLPGKWGQLLSEYASESSHDPNRDRIPSLNAEPLENDKDFAVKIKGTLGQPGSVRMIEWLE